MITPTSHETDKRAPTARPALMETSCSPRVHASIDIEDYIALFIRSFTLGQMSKAKLASALPWREKVHDNKPHKMVSACKVKHFPAIFHHFRSFSEQSLLFSPLFKRNGLRDMRERSNQFTILLRERFISVYIQVTGLVAPNSGRVIFKTTNTTFTTLNNFCTNGR